MSAVYGRLQGNRGEVTRGGSKDSGIESTLETWQGAIKTVLEADGSFYVYIGPKWNPCHLVLSGNVDKRTLDRVRMDGELRVLAEEIV